MPHTFTINTPSEPWRVVLLPSEGALLSDATVIEKRPETPLFSPDGVTVERLTADTIKVSVSAQKAAQMRQGKWSAVVESGQPRQIVSVHRNIIIVDTRKYCAEIELLRAFCRSIPTIELADLKKKF